ncbi:uncharacterized protein B0T15DRAFT_183758 [Chaetomium strumarium]|uniref:Uncharacterized protein n=1 Tax=Chaetomium strumarium TaxID=1170767 RepID=A0AAJ0GXL7_9PEZI|nr:hypothetical protein B0T15DRAFT_183758 [Chaetomium strumarium]
MPAPIEASKGALSVAQAADILLDSHKASLPRYQAYVRARHRFWEAFPGGLYTRLPTPGTDLECGFHALRLSMLHQLSSSSSSSSSSRSDETAAGIVDRKGIRIPTLEELREVFRGDTVARENERVGMANETWFTADQLAAVFSEWGRRFLGDQEGLRCQLGYVTHDSGGMPVMMNTPWVETGETGEGILRVWVYNDGLSLRGGVGHFEGLRRPTPEETQRILGEYE